MFEQINKRRRKNGKKVDNFPFIIHRAPTLRFAILIVVIFKTFCFVIEMRIFINESKVNRTRDRFYFRLYDLIRRPKSTSWECWDIKITSRLAAAVFQLLISFSRCNINSKTRYKMMMMIPSTPELLQLIFIFFDSLRWTRPTRVCTSRLRCFASSIDYTIYKL